MNPPVTASDAPAESTTPPHRSAPRRRALCASLLGLSYAGLVISLYLTFVHYRGYVAPCPVLHDCDVVQNSRYSVIAGVPLALLGAAYFAVMFYLSVGLLTGAGARLVLTYRVLAWAGALASVALILVQAVLLKAFCSYCLATEIVMLSLWGASLALTARRPDEPAASGVAPPR